MAKLDFLDDLIEFAEGASIYIKLAVKALEFLAMIFPDAARAIRDWVVEFFDIFDKETEEGNPPTPVVKSAAEDVVVARAMEEFHGSDTLIQESWARSIANLFVYIIGAQRYGEETEKMEKAVLKGYASTSEDVRNAANTHAGFKLFGV